MFKMDTVPAFCFENIISIHKSITLPKEFVERADYVNLGNSLKIYIGFSWMYRSDSTLDGIDKTQ